MQRQNGAIQRVNHPMFNVEELVKELNGAIVFSKLDMNDGF